jgi:hypothetical protein
MNDLQFLNSSTEPDNSAKSRVRAEGVGRHMGPLHSRVLAYLSSAQAGATDEELMDGTGIAPNTLRPRRLELQAMGRVEDSGMKRPIKSGRKAVVWVAT